MVKKITIAIDAMGGENAPKKNIEGLGIFLEKNKNLDDFVINLYGDEKIINKELGEANISKKKLELSIQMQSFLMKRLHLLL